MSGKPSNQAMQLTASKPDVYAWGLRWAPLILTVGFTALTHSLIWEYGRIHWEVLVRHYADLSDDVLGQLSTHLRWLHIYRLCSAALATGCAVWTSLSRPLWADIVALVFAFYAVCLAFILT